MNGSVDTQRHVRQLGLALTSVVLVVLVVFGTYEILENLWLAEAYPGFLPYFHIARGVGTAALVFLVLWWLLFTEGYLHPGRNALTFSSEKTHYPDRKSSLRLFSEWLIRLRWIAVILGALWVYLFSVLLGAIPHSNTVVKLYVLVGLLSFFNVGSYYWNRLQTNYELQILVQILFDIVTLTVLLHYSGGLANPFFLFYLFHVILASIVFTTEKAFAITTFAAACFTLLGIAEYSGWIPHHPLLGMLGTEIGYLSTPIALNPYFVFGRIVSFLVVMYGTTMFSTMLMRTLRKSRERIIHETERRGDLLERLFSVQEEERARLARELHDQIGQELSALQMKIGRFLSTMNSNTEQLTSLKTSVEDTIENVRTLSSQIRPPALEDCGLPCAINDHVTEVNKQYSKDIKFEYTGLGHQDNLSYPVDIAIYRVMQESLLNAITHSEADEISIILHKVGDELRLLVEDNGIGFDTDRLRTLSQREYLGIQGMKERVTRLDGEFELESEPGHGTRVKAVLHLSQIDEMAFEGKPNSSLEETDE